MKYLEPAVEPGELTANIPLLLKRNAGKFARNIVFQHPGSHGKYEGITWEELIHHVQNIIYNLQQDGFKPGDKMFIFSRNCLKMLELELAVMSMGGIAVPVFAAFKRETAELLYYHSDASFIAVQGDTQLKQLSENIPCKKIYIFEEGEHIFPGVENIRKLYAQNPTGHDPMDYNITPDTVCLNMYTSGTMGVPKCVQLTHGNILSQQAALSKIWNIDTNDRFLSYLPWHHSFGGIFELFTALYNGAVYSLESSYGKDPQVIFQNWKKIKPTVFFSVPKVYQSLYELSQQNNEAEKILFDSGLKFIFTAAAALPERLSDEFEKRGIPVIEGWGLTETSPCCTLTNPTLKREAGMVGMPIPGVRIRIADDDEIQVKGPNVMKGYYKNEEANKDIFTEDGWYKTGDVGEITENGLRLISRKDRIFKLSNGEKVVPSDLEKAIEKHCHYVQYAIVNGSGEDFPVALIFPNTKLLNQPDYQITPEQGCFCPRSLNELGRCLTGCLGVANDSIGQKFPKLRSAAIIMDELSIDKNTLTPSMKVAPKNVIEKYRNHLLKLYGKDVPVDEEIYIIELDSKHTNKKCIK